MSWSVVLNLGLSSNSNHFITCLLIFILHYSPQLLGPALLFNLNNKQQNSNSSSSSKLSSSSLTTTTTTPFSSNSTLIIDFCDTRSINGVQEQE